MQPWRIEDPMTQPVQQPAQPAVFYAARPFTAVRVLIFIAFACFLIAALTVATSLNIGPALAWFYGGFASWMLAYAI
jgi:hypothetical protein